MGERRTLRLSGSPTQLNKEAHSPASPLHLLEPPRRTLPLETH